MTGTYLESFFRGDYMPHGHCYLWQKHILLSHVVSDMLIAVAYFSIPVGILVFIKKRPDVGYTGVFTLFSLFILFCGFSHLIGIWTIWQGVYGIHGISKMATAIVSVATAIYTFKLLPSAVTIPSVQQFRGVKQELHQAQEDRQKLAEQLEDQKLFRFTLNALPVSTLVLDIDGTIKLHNSFFIREFKLTDNTLTGQHISSLISTENISIDDILCGDDTSDVPVIYGAINTHEEEIPIEISVTREHYAGNDVIIATVKSIKEYRQIKRELLESYGRLERAINATEDGIWELDPESNVMRCSPQFTDFLGLESEETLPFQTWLDHVHPDNQGTLKRAISDCLDTNERFYVEFLAKGKDDYQWYATTGNASADETGDTQFVCGSVRRIQAFKDMQASEAEKNNFLNAIFDGSDQAIWAVEVLPGDDFRFVVYNNSAHQRTGTKPEQLINKTLSELEHSFFTPPMARRIRSNYARCANANQAITYTEQLEINDSYWYQTSLYPVTNAQHQVTHVIGVATDITEQKRTEQLLLESNDNLERFAFAASHDLQEPLRKISAFSESLSLRLADRGLDDDSQFELSRLKDAADRMREMIQGLLALSRINSQKLNKQPLLLEDLVDDVCEDLSLTIEESNAKIIVETKGIQVFADAMLFRRVIQNLVSNSIKFHQADLPPVVRIRADLKDDGLLIRFTDNGIGMSQQATDRIFDPFTRLHVRGTYPGSGIGLAIVKQIIKVHGGTIACQSTPSHGSIFSVLLPRGPA